MATTTTPANAAAERATRSPIFKALYVLRLIAVNFLIFAVLAELICVGFVHWKKWPSTRPNYRLSFNGFDTDVDPAFGIWHRPNSHFLHQGGCFSVEYTTNSYGARDVERSVHSARPRTIVLGDSMMEGYCQPDEERMSNILEKRTGQEHLNFAASGGFSPLQYALVYRTMAAKFDHKYVVVGISPENDFHEMDPAWLNRNYSGQYRPYYQPDFSIGYLGHLQPNRAEGFWDRTEAVLRAYLASYHVGQYIYGRSLYLRTRGVYSGYNDYSDVDLARLKHALLDIKSTADAHGAQLSVFLIPLAKDFERLHRNGTNRLGPVMENWGREAGIPVKDLTPEMEARSNGNASSYFLPCDVHWTAQGSTAAAGILEPWLYGNHK
jgi:hypothetical protein